MAARVVAAGATGAADTGATGGGGATTGAAVTVVAVTCEEVAGELGGAASATLEARKTAVETNTDSVRMRPLAVR